MTRSEVSSLKQSPQMPPPMIKMRLLICCEYFVGSWYRGNFDVFGIESIECIELMHLVLKVLNVLD